jgi:hypothetical protein
MSARKAPRRVSARISSEALVFRMWREATSVNWDCTVADLAAVANCSHTYAWKIAKKRGWRLRPSDPFPHRFRPPAAVDRQLHSNLERN